MWTIAINNQCNNTVYLSNIKTISLVYAIVYYYLYHIPILIRNFFYWYMQYMVANELFCHIYFYCYFWKLIILLQLIIHVYDAPIHSCESQGTTWGCHFSPTMCFQGSTFGVQAFYQVPLSLELSFSPIFKFLIDTLLSVLVQKNFSSVLLAFRYHTSWYLMPNKDTLNCTLFLCSSRWISFL